MHKGETRPSIRPPKWRWVYLLYLIPFGALIAAAWLLGQARENQLAGLRADAVNGQLSWLEGQTHGAITLDGKLGGWDENTGKLTIRLNVGKCRGVNAYAFVPLRPSRTAGAVLHVLVPSANGTGKVDMPVHNSNEVVRLERALSGRGCMSAPPDHA